MSRGTLDTTTSTSVFAYGALTLCRRPSHAVLLTQPIKKLSTTPEILLPPVCPLPRSLATTSGISVDVSSSPYLDVSVQAVPFLRLFDSTQDTGVLLQWVLQLPEAYRSLSRPSSAPDAKAFPLRSLQLDLSNFQPLAVENLLFHRSLVLKNYAGS